MEDTVPLAGRLLVAGPSLTDPSFRRAVVLVLNHDDDGAVGVVLNRPLSIEVGAVLPGWEAVVSSPATVFQGGPVGLDGALGVVTMPPGVHPPAAVSRVTGTFGLVDLDADPVPATSGVTGLRVFAGHAGWSPGQLEAEILDGDWYVLPALPGDAVTPAPDALWRSVLRRQGGDLAIVSTFTENPSLN